MNDKTIRFKAIFKASIIGIVVNVFLALLKLIIGSLTHSLAIVSDGINNFADATSSLITMLGAALAGKAPDKKHPFGYGRIEYLSSLIISGLVLYAGLAALVEAVKSIISPSAADYSKVSLIIISIAVVIKIILSLYTQRVGKQVNSDSLIASGKESILDVFVSITTLVAAFIYISFNISIENYLAAVIAIVIIKTGIELLLETVSKLLGNAGDIETIKAVLATIRQVDNVNNAHDLVLYDYGPDTFLGSVHIDINDTLNASDIDALTRQITEAVLAKNNVYLSAIGIYSKNTDDADVIALREEIKKYALSYEGVTGFHGFYFNKAAGKISFDLVITLDIKDRNAAYANVVAALKSKYSMYDFTIGMDMDVNEL